MALRRTLIENGPTDTRSGTVYERITKVVFNDQNPQKVFKVKVSLKRDKYYAFQSSYVASVWSEKHNTWHTVITLTGEDEYAKTAALELVTQRLLEQAEQVLR